MDLYILLYRRRSGFYQTGKIPGDWKSLFCPLREGLAIYFWNAYPGASRYEATVSSTAIVDSYSGISIQGAPDVISYDVTVVDNTISGVGLTTAEASAKLTNQLPSICTR